MSGEQIDHQGSRAKRRGGWTVFAAGVLATVFVAGTYVAPYLSDGPGRLLRQVYSPLCHQIAERSLASGPGVQAVCARCAGLYIGGALGLLLAAMILAPLARRLHPAVLGVALVPSLIDGLLPWFGFAGLSNTPRLLLALPAGLAAGLFLAIGIADLVRQTGKPAGFEGSRPADNVINKPRTTRTPVHGRGTPLEVFDG